MRNEDGNSVAKKGDPSVAGAIVTDQLLLVSVDSGGEQRRDGVRNDSGRTGRNQGPVRPGGQGACTERTSPSSNSYSFLHVIASLYGCVCAVL